MLPACLDRRRVKLELAAWPDAPSLWGDLSAPSPTNRARLAALSLHPALGHSDEAARHPPKPNSREASVEPNQPAWARTVGGWLLPSYTNNRPDAHSHSGGPLRAEPANEEAIRVGSIYPTPISGPALLSGVGSTEHRA